MIFYILSKLSLGWTKYSGNHEHCEKIWWNGLIELTEEI